MNKLTEEEIKVHAAAYREHLRTLSSLSEGEIEELVAHDRCPFEPQHLLGQPLGMFHCPLCGEMVVAGLPHPKRELTPEQEAELERQALVAGEAEKVKIAEEL